MAVIFHLLSICALLQLEVSRTHLLNPCLWQVRGKASTSDYSPLKDLPDQRLSDEPGQVDKHVCVSSFRADRIFSYI